MTPVPFGIAVSSNLASIIIDLGNSHIGTNSSSFGGNLKCGPKLNLTAPPP